MIRIVSYLICLLMNRDRLGKEVVAPERLGLSAFGLGNLTLTSRKPLYPLVFLPLISFSGLLLAPFVWCHLQTFNRANGAKFGAKIWA